MSKTVQWRRILALGAVVAVAGCQTGLMQGGAGADPALAQSGAASDDLAGDLIAQGGERDVEAPEIFKLSDKALWDGRPSLGGVWVAHVSVKDPERVLIRNPSNGKTVVGALFRREFQSGGPSLQLSSDAAQELGILAGEPAPLDVVALKRVEAPRPAPAPEAAKTEAAAETATATAAAAAAPAVQPKPKPKAAAAPMDNAALTAKAAAAIEGTDQPAAETSTEEPAKKETWAERRKRKAEERAAAKAARAEAKAAAAAAKAEEKAAAEAAKAEAKAAADAGAQGAATATPAATGTGEAISVAPLSVTAAPAAGSEPVLQRPYIQIGIFSLEENAEKAKKQMVKAGFSATVDPTQSQGKTIWRVLIGPVASVAERDALMEKVKAIGYRDAYPVKK
ncbi:MAG: SPOR domain-containing protein [Paracoccaceae bacterium]